MLKWIKLTGVRRLLENNPPGYAEFLFISTNTEQVISPLHSTLPLKKEDSRIITARLLAQMDTDIHLQKNTHTHEKK